MSHETPTNEAHIAAQNGGEQFDHLGRPITPITPSYHVKISGNNNEVAKMATWGTLLTIVTLGIYRFWFTTNLRKYFWHNTLVDDSPLEYTGRGIQLFIGFLFAIAIFMPIVILTFLASQMGNQLLILIASNSIFIFAIIFGQYALYRGRRYRLSHTYWRGIRFHQDGSAWRYCGMAVLWSIITLISLGLLYPVMAAKLERYRINNTRFGNKNLTSDATWRDIAKPYYITYFATIVTFGMAIYLILPWFLAKAKLNFGNKISMGGAGIKVNFSTGLYYFAYIIWFVVTLVAGAIFGGLAYFIFTANPEIGSILAGLGGSASSAIVPLLLLLILYFAFFLVMNVAAIVYVQYYVWQTIGDSITITNADEVDAVTRGTRTAESGLGEGIADALDIGGGLEIGF